MKRCASFVAHTVGSWPTVLLTEVSIHRKTGSYFISKFQSASRHSRYYHPVKSRTQISGSQSLISNRSEMDGRDSDDSKQSAADMNVFVQDLLQRMQSRFQTMSESIVTKIDEMGGRIDELEQSINDLKTEMGVEGSPAPPAAPKAKPDEGKPEDSSA